MNLTRDQAVEMAKKLRAQGLTINQISDELKKAGFTTKAGGRVPSSMLYSWFSNGSKHAPVVYERHPHAVSPGQPKDDLAMIIVGRSSQIREIAAGLIQ